MRISRPQDSQFIDVDYKQTSGVRPSPYLHSITFIFTTFIFKLCAAVCFVVGILLMILAVGAATMDNGPGAFSMGFGSIYCACAGAAFAFIMYLLQILADIEQHSFRAAQCLSRIVESQDRKREKAQQPADKQ